jgi:hypothetical protein
VMAGGVVERRCLEVVDEREGNGALRDHPIAATATALADTSARSGPPGSAGAKT